MKNLIKQTLECDFDLSQYTDFVKNLFNEIQIQPQEIKVPDSSKEFIKKITFLSDFNDAQKKTIDIYAVELAGGTKVERARSFQRNLISKLLKDNTKDAGLVAFYSKDNPDWRLSFIKLDYKLTDRGVKVEVGTPPKRYSFLVGKTEPSHTAQKQLLPILQDHENNPLLTDLEEAFSVERVTKEFYERYRKLFEDLSKDLKKNKAFQIIAGKENIDIDDFAKKLLGQIVFLYFLQKKGWLGVPQDKTWGQGDKFFLRTLFNKAKDLKKDFYNDYLETLFYDTLNNPRRDEVDQAYSRYFDCKIPFLNGGLFEPDYDWKNTFVTLGNDIFKEIIDTFDLYNFTVKEDEPLEKEVAVDPEMLGKVFENLLPENMRKGQGAYYTPREIVHYMCQESLINHLNTETKIDTERIRKLIIFKDEDIVNGNGSRKKTLGFSDEETQRLDQALSNIKVCDPACGSGAFLVGMLNEIVSARRILEPRSEYKLKKEAIQECIYGVDIDSGAVDIAKLRLWLSLVVDFELRDIEPLPNLDYKIMCGNSLLEELIVGDEAIKLFDERLLNLKELKNNSTENARKEELKKQLKEKQAELFDLNAKNKLSIAKKKEIEAQILAINKELNPKSKKTKSEAYHPVFFADQADEYFKRLRDLHKQFFTEYDPLKKKERRKQIEEIELEFIKSSIKEKVDEFDSKIKNLNMQDPGDRKKQAVLMKKKLEYSAIPKQIRNSKTRPYFLWKLNFFEVFQEKGGFDVVIANPPYIGEKGHKELFRLIKQGSLGVFYQRKMDYFYFFIHLGFNISKEHSRIAFITTNYYPTASCGNNLRRDFKKRAVISNLINFNELKIFESALGQHNMITLLSKKNNEDALAQTCITKRNGIATPDILQGILNGEDKETSYFSIPQSELYEGSCYYIRLSGISAIQSQDPMKRIFSRMMLQSSTLGTFCNVNQGILSGVDKITDKHLKNFPEMNLVKGSGVYVVDSEEYKLLCSHKVIPKPWYKNSDINRYFTNKKNREWLIYVTREVEFQKKDLVYEHLLKYEAVIKARSQDRGEMQAALKVGKWWVIFAARKDIVFDGPKIVCPQRCIKNNFGYNEIPWYASADVYFITPKDKTISLKYILSLLNSKLYFLWLYHKGKRKGEALELYQKPLTEIPIKMISGSEQKLFVNIVNQILEATSTPDYLKNEVMQLKVDKYERQIDQMVYKLYGLNEQEIQIIEESNSS